MLLCNVFHGGSSSSSHKGVISLFEDYSVGFYVSEEEAKNLLRTAQNFIQNLKIYLKSWIKTDEEK